MSRFGLFKVIIILALIEQVYLGTTSEPALSLDQVESLQELESKLVEIKLPVKITSIEDLVGWARNAVKSMASRIDITLAAVEEPEGKKSEKLNASETREKIVDRSNTDKRPHESAGALVSTYANLFGSGNYYRLVPQDESDRLTDVFPQDDVVDRRVLPRAYLPVLFDQQIPNSQKVPNRYFESRPEDRNKIEFSNSQVVAQQSSLENTKTRPAANSGNDAGNPSPVISVPFEAIVTITREHLIEPGRTGFTKNRDPPDEFPPYFDQNPPPVSNEFNHNLKNEKTKNEKNSSEKRRGSKIIELIRTLALGNKSSDKKGNSNRQSQTDRPRKPSEKFTPPPRTQFQNEPFRQRRNETSQKQEFDDDDDEEEEPMGSLGSITDLLPLVIPILEDILDPDTPTDLGEILAAGLPLVQGLSDPNDPDAPDIIGMIGPILTNILAGKDGQGSDVAAILGPIIQLIAPLIGPVLGPLVGPLLSASSNPPQAEGSSLATLISAVLGPLVQPAEPGGMSPLSVLVAGVVAALSKELKPGLPGGLDVGALVGAVLSGVIAGTSAGLSGSLSNEQPANAPYGPGPVQAGSVNTGTSTGFQFPGPTQQRPIHGNIRDREKIVYQTTRKPYSLLPQRVPPGPPGRPPPNYVQNPRPVGALQTGPHYAATDGGSSYLPANTPVGANSVNPFGLIGSAVKDILGAAIQAASSVINAIFGIVGSSSASGGEPAPAYGPPQQGYGYNSG